MIFIIGLFYPSLHSNLTNPLIKALIFSIVTFLALSSYRKEREMKLRPKEDHSLILNLAVEMGANKDHDQTRSSITQPMMLMFIIFIYNAKITIFSSPID